MLYRTVGDIALVSKKTSLVDVCCGTGTIGLTLADRAGQVGDCCSCSTSCYSYSSSRYSYYS